MELKRVLTRNEKRVIQRVILWEHLKKRVFRVFLSKSVGYQPLSLNKVTILEKQNSYMRRFGGQLYGEV
jgi:hypothetical protein